MSLVAVILGSALFLLLGYRFYGGFLMRWLRTDDRATPAHSLRDDNDYLPAKPTVVCGQHFTAIAAAGPIVGPILAGLYFGWGAALIWILLGAVFIGGTHDAASLFASIRHKACSIAQVVRLRMSPLAYRLFLLFIWTSLLYVIIAFTDLTTASFAKLTTLSFEGIQGAPAQVTIQGAGVASSALAYLLISIGMGVAVTRFRLPFAPVAVVAVVLVGLCIWLGQQMPISFPATWSPVVINRTWDAVLLGYCFLASVLPMWLLLQPRGFLGSIFLYAVILAGVAGTLLGGASGTFSIEYPMWKEAPASIGPVLPFLFITIACGACSGFHSIVATGTTSKQLDRERDVKPVAYGAMLMEAMVAILALSTLMLLTPDQAKGLNPDAIFAGGLGRFLGLFGIPVGFAVAFGLLAFSTFIFDTLDVCTRLGRYVFQEFFGWEHPWARYVATGATLAFPLAYLMVAPDNAWRQFWTIFGTSNQLLAALTLVGLSVWMKHEGRNPLPVLLPAVFMLGITALALFHNARGAWINLSSAPVEQQTLLMLNLGIALGLMVLGSLVTIEAGRAFLRKLPVPVPASGINPPAD